MMPDNIALFHTATIRDGHSDFADRDGQSSVMHDQKTCWYDLRGLGVTREAFAAFIADAWNQDADQVHVEEYEPGVFRGWID